MSEELTTITLQEQDRVNLEKLLLLNIQGINYDGLGHDLTREQEELRQSYVTMYEALKGNANK